MATYKLIQDIEAEDKILGPLTLRQFIFALLAAFLGYVCFICIAKQVYFLLILVAPPMLLVAFFAVPFGRDQPTEVWALAKLRFMFKPRRRIWDQSGVKDLVTITVPKKVERNYTDGLSQTEVQSRLKALANTIDSRGWAIKNVNINNFAPNPLSSSSNERLLDINSIPDTVPETILQASDDILDEQNNPIAKQFENLIEQSSQNYRQKLMDTMNSTSTFQPAAQAVQAPSWFFMGTKASSISTPSSVQVADDLTLTSKLFAKNTSRQTTYGNLRTLKTINDSTSNTANPLMPDPLSASQLSTAVTTPPHPAILALANNDDLSVSTIAREAKKAKSNENDEVVISLH